jgi:hypothetical protein
LRNLENMKDLEKRAPGKVISGSQLIWTMVQLPIEELNWLDQAAFLASQFAIRSIRLLLSQLTRFNTFSSYVRMTYV